MASHTKVAPLTALAREVGAKLAALQMTAPTLHPTTEYSRSLADDLRAVWQIVDPLILAIGQQAQSDLPVQISEHDIATCFTNQLRGALEGDAAYLLAERCPELMEEIAADDAADYRRELMREGV